MLTTLCIKKHRLLNGFGKSVSVKKVRKHCCKDLLEMLLCGGVSTYLRLNGHFPDVPGLAILLGFFFTYSRREPWAISDTDFYGVVALPVRQSTMSED